MWIYLKTVYNSLSLSLLLENNVSQEFSWLIPFFAGTLQASGHLHYSTLRNSYLYFLNYLFYIQFTFLFFRDTRDSYIHPLVCFSFLSAFFFIFCFFLELFSFSPGAPWSFSWCYSAAQTFYWVFYIIILSISDCRVFISAIKLFCALLVTCASVEHPQCDVTKVILQGFYKSGAVCYLHVIVPIPQTYWLSMYLTLFWVCYAPAVLKLKPL